MAVTIPVLNLRQNLSSTTVLTTTNIQERSTTQSVESTTRKNLIDILDMPGVYFNHKINQKVRPFTKKIDQF